MQQDYSYRPRGQTSSATNGGFTVEQAQALIARHLATRTPKSFDGRCPYVGPVPFSEADARLYFGRENLIDEMLDRAERSRFIAVVGAEKVGKTSLVNAGLLFGLRNGALMDSDTWLIHRFTPGEDPVRALADACAALGDRAGLAAMMTDAIRKRGLTGPNALNDLVDMLLGPDKQRRAVLIVDQFEEVFTKPKDASDARAFINFLTQAAQNPNSRALIVIVLRSEFLPNCDTYPDLKALIDKFSVRLNVMDDAELARSIVLPALETGTKIEPQLVSRLVADVQGDPTMLPKLQLALRDLFMALPSQRGTDKVLSLIDYIDLGPIREREGDRPPVTPSANVLHLPQPLRQTVGDARAVSHFAQQEARVRRMKIMSGLTAVIAAIVLAAGLYGLVAGAMADGRARLAATSEALAYADATRSAQSASESDMARATAQVQSTQAALAREEAIATRAVAEAAATKAIEDRSAALSEKIAALDVKATAEAIATRGVVEVNRGIEMQATVSALATASAAQVGEALATSEAVALDLKTTRSREWAATALTQLGADPQLALLLALEAERAQHTPQSEDGIRRAFTAAFPDEGVFRVGAQVNDARFSPDGALLVTAGRDGRVIVWDIATRQVLTAMRAHVGPVNAAVFSDDGSRIISAGADRTARVWDVATGRSVIVLSGHTGPVNSADVSPDGALAVTGSADKTARVWDVATGRVITAPIQFTSAISEAEFDGESNAVVQTADGLLRFEARTGANVSPWEADGFPVLKSLPDGATSVSSPAYNALPLYGHTAIVRSFAQHDDRIVTASADGTARVHLIRLDNLAARAQELLGRQLACEERVRYLSETLDCAASASATATPTK